MSNEIWRVNSDYLMAFTSDVEVMRKINRSYPDFVVAAEYFKGEKVIGRQYRIPSPRKRSIVRLLGVGVSKS
jgi:hypothetical protein